MLKWVDRVAAWLLVLGVAGHTAGSFIFYPAGSEIQAWSLGSSLAGFLVCAVNLLRQNRPGDVALAAVAALGAVGWAAVCLAWGAAIDGLADPRVISHVAFAAILAALSIRAVVAGRA